MKVSTSHLSQGLIVCVISALAAGAATVLFHAASDYTTYHTALKVYSVGWFAACVLSFCCGLLIVPRSLGLVFSFAGLVAFAILCALDPAVLSKYPFLDRSIQLLPAVLFMLAWAFYTATASRNENKTVRLSSWLWLAILLQLFLGWTAFHYGQSKLHRQRNVHIVEARNKVLKLIEHLETYKNEHGAYPETLAAAGWDREATALSYRNKRINYFSHQSDFVLTFEDPLLCNQKPFSYDTAKDGWFPEDPKDGLADCPPHIFLGFLRKR